MFTTIVHPDPDTAIYRFSALTLGLVFGISALVLLGGAGMLLRRKLPPIGLGATLAGLLGLALIGPVVAHDRVTLTKKSIWQRTGFWFAPTVKGFDFAGVDRVEIVTRNEGNHDLPEDHWLVHSGANVQDIDPGDLWSHNRDTIVPWIQAAGVKVEDRR